ncbi:MAG: hypothetical protein AAF846_14760 [Chloroflexota bacterium]
MESRGYQFDAFSANEVGIEVDYHNRGTVRYPQSFSVNPIVITDIDRDFDNAISLQDEYLQELEIKAHTFNKLYPAKKST